MKKIMMLCFLFPSFVFAETSEKATLALQTTPSGCFFQMMSPSGKIVHSGTTPFIGKVEKQRLRVTVACQGYYEESTTFLLQKDKIVNIHPLEDVNHTKKSSSPSSRPVANKEEKTTLPNTTTKKEENKDGSQKTSQQPDAKKEESKEDSQKKKVKTVAGVAKKELQVKKKVPWIPLALSGGLLIGGAVFFGLSQSNLSESQNKTLFQTDAYGKYKAGLDQRQTGMYLLIAGALAGGIAGVMYFWGKPSNGKDPSFFNSPKSTKLLLQSNYFSTKLEYILQKRCK